MRKEKRNRSESGRMNSTVSTVAQGKAFSHPIYQPGVTFRECLTQRPAKYCQCGHYELVWWTPQEP